MYKVIKGLLIILLVMITHSDPALAGVAEFISDGWNQFWTVTCELSKPASARSKRSLELPNPNDADEFFEYLYPSLNLKPESVVTRGARSLSITSWWEDLIAFWETECLRKPIRSVKRKSKRGKSKSRNSTLRKNTAFNQSSSNLIKKIGPAFGDGEYLRNTSQYTGKDGRQGDILGVDIPGPLSGLSSIPTLLPTLPTPTIDPLALKVDNKWFQSYGGDLEYFYPLIGFGIPFDGEITLLGFHGFKGLFPYKKK